MTTQIEMFPAQEADRMQAVLNYLIGRRDKVEKALTTARQNLYEIEALIEKQEAALRLVRDHSVSQMADEDVEIVEDAEITDEEEPLPAIDGVAVTDDGTEYETATGEVVECAVEDAPWEYEGPEPAHVDEETAA
jgi:tryptophan 2,3-dioxygenase